MAWFKRKEGTRNHITDSRISLTTKAPPPPPPRQTPKVDKIKLVEEYIKNIIINDLDDNNSLERQKGRNEICKSVLKFIDTL